MNNPKFRAWDKTTKTMVLDYAHVGQFGELYVTQFHSSAYSEDGCPDLILEQYAGLKDKNGKEIFAGDMVKAWIYSDETPQILAVEFRDGCFLIDYEDSKNDCVPIALFDGTLEITGTIRDEEKP